MTASELLDLAWSYPLFEALYGRRSRRFGLGFEMPEGPFRYKSAHTHAGPPERDRGSAAGRRGRQILPGLALWDLPTPAALPLPQRPHIPDGFGLAATRRFSSPTMKGSMSSMRTSRRATCARSRAQTSGPSSSKRTARSVESFAVAGSTFRAVYRR